ncbi:MAG: adenosylhomocysteinase [Clostridia bacterium]|nr:adenosylhomocysteinase [Clostridia bacterium]
MQSIIRNPAMAEEGRQKIAWAAGHMPVLGVLAEEFERERPFAGLRVAVSVHLEAKTAYLAQVMKRGGAEVAVMGSNPLSTQDAVCAGLAASGVTVFATHNCTAQEYEDYLIKGLSIKPHLIIDDGGDMVQLLHESHRHLAEHLIGGCEETTTGVLRLRARAAAGQLNFPMMTVNDGDCKHLFDNRYGTGQSVWDGILRTTNLIAAGQTAVVAGYGWCGRGVALRAKGLGARVIVTEVDPVKAIEAVMDGFEVMPMMQAAPLGDFFITVTGCKQVITEEHLRVIKEGAILSNAGHFDVEVDVACLRGCAVRSWQARRNIEGFELPCGKTVYLLGEGRLVNLVCADGHPAEIMDMSFALQALCARHLAQHGRGMKPGAYPVPAEIDRRVAELKLHSWGCRIDALSEAQAAYLAGWEV